MERSGEVRAAGPGGLEGAGGQSRARARRRAGLPRPGHRGEPRETGQGPGKWLLPRGKASLV